MLKSYHLLTGLIFFCFAAVAQPKTGSGLLTGNVMDSRSKALEGATIRLVSFTDSLLSRSMLSDNTWQFSFNCVSFGYDKFFIY